MKRKHPEDPEGLDDGEEEDLEAENEGLLEGLEDSPFLPSFSDDEEAGLEYSLRPANFSEFVGQKRVVENLLIAIETAKEREEVLDHILFSGMPGLGKTTLANLVTGAMGVQCRSTSGPALEHGRDLLGLLTSLQKGDILFIDEIHRMSREAEEYLYSSMEDFHVDIVVDKGPDARTYRIPVQPFTLIGATTREGMLSAPFRSRFGIQEKLETYSDEELAEIIRRSSIKLGTEIDPAAGMELARRARGTPRYANRFLRRVRDVAQWRARRSFFNARPPGGKEAFRKAPPFPKSGRPNPARPGGDGLVRIGLAAVEEGLERLGVDANGLDRVDRRILEILLANRQMPVGVKTISVSVGEEERTIEEVYEPHLIRLGLILKTPRGRVATERAAEILGKSLFQN
ncbi:MAG: Holliday junction branch migration DNA helicase RuvB [Planctomycetes bacterium]|nr:Holliday junction branch migration DNA helicase RuvB [Planctomycetota bacterium]